MSLFTTVDDKQLEEARAKMGAGDPQKLLRSGDTWTVN